MMTLQHSAEDYNPSSSTSETNALVGSAEVLQQNSLLQTKSDGSSLYLVNENFSANSGCDTCTGNSKAFQQLIDWSLENPQIKHQ